MKKLLSAIAFVCLSVPLFAQNLATVSASNIQDLNGAKLAAGQLCFLGTDNNDNPISFQVGGGGQVLKRSFCSAVAAGVVTSFTVPNPANTSPTGIYYRVTVKDSSTGVEVLRYTGVTFSGGTFGFDTYTPNITGASFSPLSGTSVTGNLSVSGNLSVTGTFAAGSLGSIGVTALTDSGSLTQTQPTAATAGANQSSFLDCEQGTYWNGAASASDQYCWQDVISAGTNPTTTWTLTHSGSSGSSVMSIPTTTTLATGPISATTISGTTLTTTGQILSNGGTVSAPAFSFSAEPASGWFRQQAGIMGFGIANSYLTQYSATRIGNAPAICIGWAAGAPNSNSDDSTICRASASNLKIGNGAGGFGTIQSSVSINGGTALTGQTGTGTSVVTNTGPTITSPTLSGSPSISGATITTSTVAAPVLTTGMCGTSSTACQHKRATLTSPAAGALSTANTTVTWTTAFADTSYTTVCGLETLNAIGHISHYGGKAAGSIIVAVVNDTATAITGTIDCIAMHD